MTIEEIINAGFGFTDFDKSEDETILSKALQNRLGSIDLITVLSIPSDKSSWYVITQRVIHVSGSSFSVESYKDRITTIEELQSIIQDFSTMNNS